MKQALNGQRLQGSEHGAALENLWIESEKKLLKD